MPVERRPAGLALAEVSRRVASAGDTLPIQLGLSIALQLADGLRTVHSSSRSSPREVVFGDRFLTPEAVIVGFDGEVQIAGFGVAPNTERLATTDPGVTDRIIGYMAPEQLRGDDADLRADLFSLGTLLFEMLTGRRLYGGSPHQARVRVLTEPPPDLGEERADCPPELVELLFELLCKEPNARPASAEEVSRRLTALLEARVAWEGEIDLAAFVLRLATDEELDGDDAMDDVLTAVAKQTVSPTRQGHRVIRDVAVVALLLVLSAAMGLVARLLFP